MALLVIVLIFVVLVMALGFLANGMALYRFGDAMRAMALADLLDRVIVLLIVLMMLAVVAGVLVFLLKRPGSAATPAKTIVIKPRQTAQATQADLVAQNQAPQLPAGDPMQTVAQLMAMQMMQQMMRDQKRRNDVEDL